VKVEVQLVNEKGRGIPAKDRTRMPKYRGVMRIQEARNHALGRNVVIAELLSSTDGADAPLIPALLDAGVLFLSNSQMRIRGFELIEGTQYGQTWDVKVS
jgi:hypothetical protein